MHNMLSFSCAISILSAVLVSFVLLMLIASCPAQQMSSREPTQPEPRKRQHTHRHLRRISLRASTAPSSEIFTLNCPHVADANNEQVRIEVTWTKDDTIWLKIENGERRIYNKLSSFDKKRIGKKSVLHVTLNKGRYAFGYDELTGDFGMEIRPVIGSEDEGIWQCHVTVHQKGDTYTLTSRSRVKNLQSYQQNRDEERSRTDHGVSSMTYLEDAITEKKDSISSFTRHEHSTIEISRDTAERQQAVVFDRHNLPQSVHGSSTGRHMAIVDYEDDGNTNSDYSMIGRHNRKRHRHSPNHASTLSTSHIFAYLFTMILLTIC